MDRLEEKAAGEGTLRVGDLVISPPLALAPMVGLSHSVMRTLLMEMGGPGLLFTEMLAVKRLPHENGTSSPFLVRGSIERPLFYQIFISDVQYIERAVHKLEEFSADGIDINLGCPAPQVRKTGAGGYLADDPDAVRKIVRELRRSTTLPLSAKMRLGRDLDADRLVGFCKMLEGEGVDLLTVHARLHKEKFCRPPRWERIGAVKQNVSIPVLANGGIFTVEDAEKCLQVSGADGLMIGRGGIENPWVFSEIASCLFGVKREQAHFTHESFYSRFVQLLSERFVPERRLGRLKEFTHYFSKAYSFGHYLASAVQMSETVEEAAECAQTFFSRNQPKSKN